MGGIGFGSVVCDIIKRAWVTVYQRAPCCHKEANTALGSAFSTERLLCRRQWSRSKKSFLLMHTLIFWEGTSSQSLKQTSSHLSLPNKNWLLSLGPPWAAEDETHDGFGAIVTPALGWHMAASTKSVFCWQDRRQWLLGRPPVTATIKMIDWVLISAQKLCMLCI